ncbi:hypothetical protein D4764_04G0010790 [Takifugu flavidus]|uniref:Uncharacterized protein n=1 Tax=Takifugu flavidus TaxID=433684 RepID=A0A5C6N4P0_9TELE|nr:hypothetical protein D4764_04G0010790 [Takifugu flavidus]
MAFQNRIAVDMLLAEKGGVCAVFGDQCCTFIPNNTASDGSLTLAIEGLHPLNSKMKEHSGAKTAMWDEWMNVFGKSHGDVQLRIVSIAVEADAVAPDDVPKRKHGPPLVKTGDVKKHTKVVRHGQIHNRGPTHGQAVGYDQVQGTHPRTGRRL